MVLKVFFVIVLLAASSVHAAPKKDLDPYWSAFASVPSLEISHSDWQDILTTYVITDTKGQTFFSYNKVSQEDHNKLTTYLERLTSINPHQLTRSQQFPYWINLYNAATIQLVLENYPIKSITKLGKGFFSFGPWDDDILTINNRKVSLNDIEHRILRPIFHDERIHYAVNCASYSCPNLATEAFTQKNIESLLQKGARDYINHARGVRIEQKTLILSSIYKWYQNDFGQSEKTLIQHLKKYASENLNTQLEQPFEQVEYQYQWELNEAH